MSGPKVDIAALREQEKKRLEAARDKRKNLAKKLMSLIQKIKGELVAPDSQQGKNILALQTDCVKNLEKLLREVCEGNETLDCDRILRESEYLTSDYDAGTKSYFADKDLLKKNEEEQRRLEKQKQAISRMTRNRIMAIAPSSDNGPEPLGITHETVLNQVREFVGEIKAFIGQSGIPVSKKNTILGLHRELTEIAAADMDDRKKSRRIADLFEDYEHIKKLAEKELETMRYVYERYTRECFDAPGGVRSFEEFRSAEEIEEAIRLSQSQSSEQLSEEYIRRQINEVMSRHGYDIIRSDQLIEAPSDGQMLYEVNDKTAINVYVSKDNQVTMRVVGIGFNEGISSQEDEELYQQQCAFCSLHPQITAELKMRGVILQAKRHLPPDKKYNKKIQTKSTGTVHHTNRAKKELRRTQKKVMHKE